MIDAQPLAKVHTAPCSIKVLYSVSSVNLKVEITFFTIQFAKEEDVHLKAGQKPSLERQSTLYDESKSSTSLAAAAPAASDVSTAEEELEFYGGDYYGSDYQQYDAATGYEYNYSDYYGADGGSGVGGGGGDDQQQALESYPGYVLDETGTWVVDDGSLSHDYGYYDETGYYYDGQWYPADSTTYDESGAASWTTADGYADYTTQQQGTLIIILN